MSTPATLAARLGVLEDVAAIEALKYAYWRAIDRKTPDALAGILSPDIEVDFEGMAPCAGLAAFLAVVRPEAARTDTFHMHHGKHPRIEITGTDEALGEWEVFYTGTDAATGMVTTMRGAYWDRYRRQDGRWWITAMRMRVQSLQVARMEEGGALTALVLGKAG